MNDIVRFLRPTCLLALVCAFATGCISEDKHVFKSLPYRPLTVSVIQTDNQQELWAYDIPVGYKLVLDFNTEWKAEQGFPGMPAATEMVWSLYKPETPAIFFNLQGGGPVESRKVTLPGATIAMKVTVRDVETEPVTPPVPGPAVAPAVGPGEVQQPGEAEMVEPEPAAEELPAEAIEPMEEPAAAEPAELME